MIGQEKRESANSLYANFNTPIRSINNNQRYNYIPVDYFKGVVKNLSREHFFSNKNLEFTAKLEFDEIKHEYVIIDGMKLKVFPSGRITISGSIHKFYNNGEHNHDQFSEYDFINSIRKLDQVFRIKPENIFLTCLEFGVNIILNFITVDAVLDNLLLHHKTEFEQNINYKHGYYKQAKHDKEIEKAYHKSKQYKLLLEIFRWEIKQTNWSEYRAMGIVTLNDFINSDKTIFVEKLIQRWDEVILYEPTIENNKWDKYSNINFWRNLKTKSRTTWAKHKNRLNEIAKDGRFNTKELIKQKIRRTIQNLQGVTYSNFSVKDRICKVTGIDISNQRNDSFLLSHTGLKKLKTSDSTTYEEIKKIFLSDNWETSSTEAQIREIAHNIRSRYNYHQKAYLNQIQLF